MKTRFITPLLGLLATFAVAAGCKEHAQSLAMPARPPARVAVTPATTQDVPLYIEEIGRTAAIESVTIQPQVTGLTGGRSVVDRDRRFLVMASPERDLVGLERGRRRRLLEDMHVAERTRLALDLGEGRLNRGGKRPCRVCASRSEQCQRERDQGVPNGHTMLRVHSVCYQATEYWEKWCSATVTNSRVTSFFDHSCLQGSAFALLYQMASCCFSAASIASTTPSSLRSGFAF